MLQLAKKTPLRVAAVALTATAVIGTGTGTASAASGPVVPLRQAGTGYHQWYNCGPTSMVMAMLRLGKKPKGYVSPTNYSKAVANMRAAMTPSTPHGNHTGSNIGDVLEGLRKNGKSGKVTRITTAMEAARKGKVSIVWGDENAKGWRELWAKNLNAPPGKKTSHIVALVGYKGGKYQILDPLSKASSNRAHWVTSRQLNIYSNGAGSRPTNVVIN